MPSPARIALRCIYIADRKSLWFSGPKVRSKVEEELAALNEIKSKDAVVSPVGDADVVYRWDK